VVDIYAVTLPLALAAAAIALALAAYIRLTPGSPSAVRRVRWWAGIGALGLIVLSTAGHLLAGHRPGSPSALAPAAFVGEHPALAVISAMAAGALLLLRWTRPASGTR